MTYRTTRQFYQTVFPANASADPNFRTSMWMLPGEMDVTLSLEGWHASYRRAVAFQNSKLVWIRRGSVAIVQRGKLLMRSEGDVFLIRRGEAIGILPVNDQRFRMVTLDLTDALIAAAAQSLGKEPGDLESDLSGIGGILGQYELMQRLSIGLIRATNGADVANHMSRFIQAILSLPEESLDREGKSSNYHPITESILSLIETQCPPRINLRQLEQNFGYSRGHIIAIFKNDLQTTPQQFLLTYKVGVAAERLIRGTSLHDLVFQLNFADQSHLTRAFQACLGVSPMRFSNQVRRRIAA